MKLVKFDFPMVIFVLWSKDESLIRNQYKFAHSYFKKKHNVIHQLYLSSFEFYDEGFKKLNKVKQVVMNLKLINIHLQAMLCIIL